jgi:cation transport regulator ChaC
LTTYFAYGSNMASSEMELACPGHRFLGAARLDGYRLEFRRRSIRWRGGAADAVPVAGACMWGALYELPAGGFEGLDAKEGAGFAYSPVTVEVELASERRPAVAYVVERKEPEEVPPTGDYVALLLAGARERELPLDYVSELEGRARACA